MKLDFEWDLVKATINTLKHSVSFEEASTVFDAEKILVKLDIKHSLIEERKLALGLSNENRLLVVVFTERTPKIRIISARRANRKEIEQYETFTKGH